MSYKRCSFIIIAFCLLSFGLQSTQSVKPIHAFSPQVIQQGAVGEDVIELQARLQYIGFYNGKVDGVFGWSTYWALRNFQYEFGLEIDGMGGATTKEKLAKATKYDEKTVKSKMYKGGNETHYGNEKQAENQAKKTEETKKTEQPKKQEQSKQEEQPKKAETNSVNVPQGYSQNDIQLMANAVYGEARGEPYVGQVAVAAVILNRVKSPTFPNTAAGVIFEPRAFTAVADGQIWLTPNDTAKKAVLDAINGWDPSGNADYYFNPDTATSGWIWTRPQIKKIGKHIFAK